MDKLINYRYYIFDFDLTLMDTSDGITNSAREVLLAHPEITCVPDLSKEHLQKIIGMTLEDGFRFLVPEADEEMIGRFATEYRAAADILMMPGTHPYAGTAKVLSELKARGIRVGICSLKIKRRVVEALEAYGLLKYVDFVLGAENVVHPKPHPEGLNVVMDQLGASDPREVVYIGDSVYDAGTAQNAGVDFIGVTTGNASAEELGQYPNVRIIKDLSEII